MAASIDLGRSSINTSKVTAMKNIILLGFLLVLSGCTHTVIVPQLVMPTPPELLMRPPGDLKPIKQNVSSTPVNK
jgi:hypothetical protein